MTRTEQRIYALQCELKQLQRDNALEHAQQHAPQSSMQRLSFAERCAVLDKRNREQNAQPSMR